MPKETIHSNTPGVPHLEKRRAYAKKPYSRIVVIGDIHGQYDAMMDLLKGKLTKKDLLIINGDMINKGPKSFDVLKLVYDLKHDQEEDTEVIVLRGNHENLFIKFLDRPKENGPLFLKAGGIETLQSINFKKTTINKSYLKMISGALADRNMDVIMDYIEPMAEAFKETYPHLVKMLHESRLYFKDEFMLDDQLDVGQIKQNVITHAGVNLKNQLNKPDLSNGDDLFDNHTDPLEFLTIRDDFHEFNLTSKETRYFVGHTPTRFLHEKIDPPNDAIHVSKDGLKVSMDGAAHKYGQLHVAYIMYDRYATESIIVKK